MNPLLYEDLFVIICHHMPNIKTIISFELISKKHSFIIRNTPWYQQLNIINETIFKHIGIHYKFKNLHLFYKINVNNYIDYLKKCYILDLRNTNINDEGIKALNCHTLCLRGCLNITDEGLKH